MLIHNNKDAGEDEYRRIVEELCDKLRTKLLKSDSFSVNIEARLRETTYERSIWDPPPVWATFGRTGEMHIEIDVFDSSAFDPPPPVEENMPRCWLADYEAAKEEG